MEAGMQQASEKKGTDKRGGNTPKTQPAEAGFASMSHTRNCPSLIQDQVPELIRLQQKMKVGKVVSSHLIHHVKNTIKNFEELLSKSKIDHYMEQHFLEQLANGRQLAESLASKFSTDNCTTKKNLATQMQQTLCILRDIEKKRKVLDPKLDAQPQISSSSLAQPARPPASLLPPEQEAPPVGDVANVGPATPAGSASLPFDHSGAAAAQPFYGWSDSSQGSRTPETGRQRSSGPWDEMRPQKMNASGDLSSFSSLYRCSSKPSGADLLEKNLVEIQNLRQRLEESVSLNDRLRERLQLVLSDAEQGKGTAQPGTDVFPHSHTQGHASGFGQDVL